MDINEEAARIYQAYPRKAAKPKALRAIKTALGKCEFQKLLNAVETFAKSDAGRAGEYVPYPATWFNQERFNDDPNTWKHSQQRRAGYRAEGRDDFADLASRAVEV